MRIVVLSEGDAGHASVEHRILLPLERLRSSGVVATVVPGRRRRIGRSVVWWVGARQLARVWKASARADLLLVHRTSHVGVAVLCWSVRWRRRIPIVFDFDDALHVKRWGPFPHPLYAALPWVLRASTTAWCGSHAVLDFAGRFTRSVWIPTPAAPVFLACTPRGGTPPTIVWMGNGPIHVESLALLVEPLERLARVSRFRLRLLSTLGSETVRALFASLKGRVEIDWGWDTWQPLAALAAAVEDADIGVMPLVDSPWHRGKCALKALESMAAGLPVVCSAVGENTVLAGVDGEHAIVAKGAREWYRALRALVTCPNLRAAYGERGRRRVRAGYDLEAVCRAVVLSLSSMGLEVTDEPSQTAR